MAQPRSSIHRNLRPALGTAGMIYGSVLIFVASTAGSAFAEHFDRPRTAALVYVLGVTVIGAIAGLRGGLAAALAASLIFNFFLSEPILQFSATSADEIVPLVVFNTCAIISGLLAGRLNDRARIAERAQARLNILLTVSDRLQKVVLLADVVTAMNGRDIQPWLGRLELYDADGLPVGIVPADAKWQDLAWFETDDGTCRSDSQRATAYRLVQSDLPLGTAVFGDPQAPSHGRIVDMAAIVALVAITVERCLLLQQLSQAEAVRRSEELKTALLSSLSHDMRTPLSAIAASASSLVSLSDDLNPSLRLQLLRTIEEQCARLDRYTANLLDLGRLQAGIDLDQLVDVDIVEILGTVLRSSRTQGGSHVIAKQIESASAIVRANPVMVEQIFRNLLDNAIRYSPEGSTIALKLSVSEDQMCVEIIDQGCGVPKDELPRLFDRFYRSSRTAQLEGQGLGLPIAKGFTEAFGGRIDINSPHAGGLGTQILVRLPLSRTRAEAASG